MFNANKYSIYTPDENIETVKNVLPMGLYRLRTVKLYQNHYISCSCGLPVRRKIPCRHILFVMRRFSIEMIAPRWLKMYQYDFERPGNNRLTKLYRQVESDHYIRDIEHKEAIYVHSIPGREEYLLCESYPVLMSNTIEYDKNDLLLLQSIQDRNDIAIRGYPISEQASNQKSPANYADRNMVINFSQETQDVLNNDRDFISNLQDEQIRITVSSSLTTNTSDSEIILKVREILNVVARDKQLKQEVVDDIDNMYRKYMNKRKRMTDDSDESNIQFSHTGQCNLKYDKRK